MYHDKYIYFLNFKFQLLLWRHASGQYFPVFSSASALITSVGSIILVYSKAPKQAKHVYCKTKRASTTATIGKVGFQSKQWIGCRPNNSVAYTDKVRVRGTLAPCNKRVLAALPFPFIVNSPLKFHFSRLVLSRQFFL